jgi:16S rRNA (uracil1498-N3)-methyltransferase
VRITRLYQTADLTCGKTTQLDKDTSSHLVRVLRTKAETAVILFNGDGYDYLCKTINNHPKKTLVAVESRIKINNESNLFITLIQGLSRLDRMETTIQKSVELGVNKIIPVLCQYSNTRINEDKQHKKLSHWSKVAISACEQSGRSIIPEIAEISSLNKIDSLLHPDALKIILNPATKKSLKEINIKPNEKNNSRIEIFIGPEGGLAEDEISHLQALQFQNICFGPRILRTETAGPAVISAVQMLWGDF